MPRRFNGKAMRQLRQAADLTMADLVTKIADNTGCTWTRGHLYGVEKGKQQPGLHLSHAIADALGVPWDRLMTPGDLDEAITAALDLADEATFGCNDGEYRAALTSGDVRVVRHATTASAALEAACEALKTKLATPDAEES